METDQAKNRREFNRIASPLYANVYGAAMRFTRNPAEADDLTQDTMVRAWRFWSTFQQGSNVKAWLFTILRNTFINGYHREGRRSAGLSDVEAHARALGDDVALGRAGGSSCDAESAVDAETRAEAIRQALAEVAAVSPDYALAVELADLEGWSYKEIAEVCE